MGQPTHLKRARPDFCPQFFMIAPGSRLLSIMTTARSPQFLSSYFWQGSQICWDSPRSLGPTVSNNFCVFSLFCAFGH